MATTVAQRRWREKNRFVKTQLNVMTRRLVHEDLSEISDSFRLRGKGEAVSFAVGDLHSRLRPRPRPLSIAAPFCTFVVVQSRV